MFAESSWIETYNPLKRGMVSTYLHFKYGISSPAKMAQPRPAMLI